jgi:UDP-GlcNAc3NAcA epimerase
MNKIKIVHILGARPNFIKAAPVIDKLSNNFHNICVHTEQHYDYEMSSIFFQELNIPTPDYHLGVGSGTQGIQTGKAIIKIEEVLLDEKPDGVIIYGDVNSTLSAAIAASKLFIPIFHIESASRSYGEKIPEEVNRILVDNISTLLFCTEQSAYDNIKKESLPKGYLVGNTAIDSLHKVMDLIVDKKPPINDYYLCTLHRPFNVDDDDKLNNILTRLNNFSKPVLFPAHPRVKDKISSNFKNIKVIKSVGYLDFISYIVNSKGVISDSGGVQCDCGFLKKPLLTLRPNIKSTTPHPMTLDLNNRIVDVDDLDESKFKKCDYSIPDVWDGKSSDRINKIIMEYYN